MHTSVMLAGLLDTLVVLFALVCGRLLSAGKNDAWPLFFRLAANLHTRGMDQ